VISFCAFSASLRASFSRAGTSGRRKGEGFWSVVEEEGIEVKVPHVICGAPRSVGLGVETKL